MCNNVRARIFVSVLFIFIYIGLYISPAIIIKFFSILNYDSLSAVEISLPQNYTDVTLSQYKITRWTSKQ